MPSTVGFQDSEGAVLAAAVQLALDCERAYQTAADRCRGPAKRQGFAKLAADCGRHVRAWQERLRALNNRPARRNAVSHGLNWFKVEVARLLGDRAVVAAVANNPRDCCEAYERIAHRRDISSDTRQLAQRLSGDAAAHLDWIDQALQAADAPPPPRDDHHAAPPA